MGFLTGLAGGIFDSVQLGGVEVRSESIDEAIASASERMKETRRGRELLTLEPRTGLRQAV